MGLEPLLVGHKLLLHEQPVLDALHLQEPQLALGVGRDRGQLGAQTAALAALALPPAHPRRRRGRLPLLLGLVLWPQDARDWAAVRLGCVCKVQQQCLLKLHAMAERPRSLRTQEAAASWAQEGREAPPSCRPDQAGQGIPAHSASGPSRASACGQPTGASWDCWRQQTACAAGQALSPGDPLLEPAAGCARELRRLVCQCQTCACGQTSGAQA